VKKILISTLCLAVGFLGQWVQTPFSDIIACEIGKIWWKSYAICIDLLSDLLLYIMLIAKWKRIFSTNLSSVSGFSECAAVYNNCQCYVMIS